MTAPVLDRGAVEHAYRRTVALRGVSLDRRGGRGRRGHRAERLRQVDAAARGRRASAAAAGTCGCSGTTSPTLDDAARSRCAGARSDRAPVRPARADLPVLDNVALPLLLDGHERARGAHGRRADWLDRVRRADRRRAAGRAVRRSGTAGGLARALVTGPRCSSPTSRPAHLDRLGGSSCSTCCWARPASRGRRVVLVTHDPSSPPAPTARCGCATAVERRRGAAVKLATTALLARPSRNLADRGQAPPDRGFDGGGRRPAHRRRHASPGCRSTADDVQSAFGPLRAVQDLAPYVSVAPDCGRSVVLGALLMVVPAPGPRRAGVTRRPESPATGGCLPCGWPAPPLVTYARWRLQRQVARRRVGGLLAGPTYLRPVAGRRACCPRPGARMRRHARRAATRSRGRRSCRSRLLRGRARRRRDPRPRRRRAARRRAAAPAASPGRASLAAADRRPRARRRRRSSPGRGDATATARPPAARCSACSSPPSRAARGSCSACARLLERRRGAEALLAGRRLRADPRSAGRVAGRARRLRRRARRRRAPRRRAARRRRATATTPRSTSPATRSAALVALVAAGVALLTLLVGAADGAPRRTPAAGRARRARRRRAAPHARAGPPAHPPRRSRPWSPARADRRARRRSPAVVGIGATGRQLPPPRCCSSAPPAPWPPGSRSPPRRTWPLGCSAR